MGDVKTIPHNNYRISCSYLYYPVLYLQFGKMKTLFNRFIALPNLFHFQTNIYNGLVFENATYFAFLLCYLKILFILTPMIDAMETHLQS